jgi:hypothetical protein
VVKIGGRRSLAVSGFSPGAASPPYFYEKKIYLSIF